MSVPVYHVVFHQGHWRIKYEDLYLGEYATAEAAAGAALEVARSRLTPNLATQILTDPNGEILVCDPEYD
jgi:hypothetical protein